MGKSSLLRIAQIHATGRSAQQDAGSTLVRDHGNGQLWEGRGGGLSIAAVRTERKTEVART